MPQFIEDLAAVIEAIGTDKPGIAFGLANANWEDAEQRDEFLRRLTQKGGPGGR